MSYKDSICQYPMDDPLMSYIVVPAQLGLVAVCVAVHQPASDRTLAVSLDLAPDLEQLK